MTETARNRRVTVFTGSRHGKSPVFVQAVEQFATTAVARGYDVVFGGGNVGLMGVLADATLQAGGRVTGVMPESLVHEEIPHPQLSQLVVVPNMHARKQRMADLGDVFVALPGGAGTLEELFEVWTWQQLGLHTKPVALLNIAGFWDPLLTMIKHMADQGFIRHRFMGTLLVESTPDALFDAFETR